MAKKAYIGVDGKARKVKKGYVGVENFVPRALPSGYTQVEYIQSSGTQYINTLVAHSSSNNIVLQADLSYDTVSPSNQIMGFNGSAGNGIGTSGAAWWEASGIANATVGTRYALEWGVNGSNWHRTVNGKTVTGTRSSTSFTTNMYLFAAQASATSTSMSYYCSCKLYSAKVLVNGNVVRDYVPCKNSSGTVGLYDVANGSFYQNSGSGTFVAGATSGSVARKIKKAYIGIGGVARPCFGSGELVYYGKVGDLGEGRTDVGAANAGNYLVFASGYTGNSSSQYLDAVNASLTVTTNKYGVTGYRYGAAASAGGVYALFGGGTTGGASRYNYSGTVQAINGSLTKSYTQESLSIKVIENAGASVGPYAIFSGGASFEANADPDNKADAFNSSLTKTALSILSASCREHMGATSEKFAIFAGGFDSNNNTLTNVTAYDNSLTKKTTTMGTGRSRARGTEVGGHVLVAGGFVSGSGATTLVEAFNTSLTRTTAPSLASAQSFGPSGITTLKGFAMFMGGGTTCNVYDESLTRTATFSISAKHGGGGAGVVGDYLVIGGGYDDTGGYTNSGSTRIDAFAVV